MKTLFPRPALEASELSEIPLRQTRFAASHRDLCGDGGGINFMNLKEPEPNFPSLTEYEERVFAMFWKEHIPGYAFTSIQLEGDRQLPIVAAGLRLKKKGIVYRFRSCSWGLSALGELMAEDRQKQNGFKPRKPNL